MVDYNVNSSLCTYDAIKKALSSISISPNHLEELKNFFQTEIASKRLRECIRSVKDLLDVIERRDVISENDITNLYAIIAYCEDTTYKGYLDHYTPPKQPMTYENQYRELRLRDELSQNLRLHYRNSHSTTSVVSTSSASSTAVSFVGVLTDVKRKAVYKKLTSELGKYWRSFGRELDIREGDMDNIEQQFPYDLSSRIYKLLRMFEEDDSHDPKKELLIICRALDKCNRKDLRRKVEVIMSF